MTLDTFDRPMKVAIVGASGFTGAELLRLCATHPDLEVIAATGETQAGTRVADLYPSLAGAYGDLTYVPSGHGSVLDAELVFLGLPHGASQPVVPGLRGQVEHIVDLASDFRLDDPSWTKQMYDGFLATFLEDVDILEAQQASLDRDPDRPLIDLNVDAPGLAARRVLADRIAAEQSPGGPNETIAAQ